MEIQHLEGVVAILPTPLTDTDELDEEGLRQLVRHCVASRLDGVALLGSNGELAYLTAEEKHRAMQVAAEAAAGEIPVIGTASAASTREALRLARSAKQAGCNAVMAALPTYWRVTAGEARDHIASVAQEGGLPVFFYHFPEVTGLSLTPSEIAQIAALDGVIGTKLTVSHLGFLREVIARTRPSGWRVFTGTSFLLDACVSAGGAGVFCPLPLLIPAEIRELAAASRNGDRARAARLQAQVLRGIPLFSGTSAWPALQALGFRLLARLPYRPGRRAAPTHARLKEALRQCGHPMTAAVRRPLRGVDEAERASVRRSLALLAGPGRSLSASPAALRPGAPGPSGRAGRS